MGRREGGREREEKKKKWKKSDGDTEKEKRAGVTVDWSIYN